MGAPLAALIPIVCPECKGDDVGTVERHIGIARVAGCRPEPGRHGEFAYTGETKIDWDSSTTATEDSKPVLECRTCLTQFTFDPSTHRTAVSKEPHVIDPAGIA